MGSGIDSYYKCKCLIRPEVFGSEHEAFSYASS